MLIDGKSNSNILATNISPLCSIKPAKNIFHQNYARINMPV